MMRSLFLLLALLGGVTASASAHELRPAYLELTETGTHVFSVLWKVPAVGDMRLGLDARLPDTCKGLAEPTRSIENYAYMERWSANCEGGLQGKLIRIDGLSASMTDALVRISYADGSTEIARLTPQAPLFAAKGTQTMIEVAEAYTGLGIDHIFGGIDHLSFVLALLLLIGDRWTLLKTISAFTLAHSITLSGSVLGYFSLPQKPVEASIALSIAFVARELVKLRSGDDRLAARLPWLVAFAFGLLHGFGFAAALKETGLPQVDVPIALLTFNIGVEIGQILFVAAIWLSWTLFAAITKTPIKQTRMVGAYAIGTFATILLISRLAQLGG